MRLHEFADALDLPDLAVGVEIRMGKFRNRRATIQGFDTDDPRRPKVKTSKGTRNVLTFDLVPDPERSKREVSKLRPAPLDEARVEQERWKFWFNARTSEILWFGGAEHHAHALHAHASLFGLSDEQAASLAAHPAMNDAPEDEDGEPDLGARIIYLPDLFWQVMQRGWVRGGLEGPYDPDDHAVMQPHGLYLEGKSLPDLARAARFVATEAAGDAEFPDEDADWHVDTLRLSLRAGPTDRMETSHRLAGERAAMFMKTGRIPSETMR